MDHTSIYSDIAQRTGGNIYIGVVGPVRTGKSTFIKRFMQSLVLPNLEDEIVCARATDELPQSGSGKTIMTSEPKFVPEEAVTIRLSDAVEASVRLIDSVGFMIPGAAGQFDDNGERLVTTPWFDHEIPMHEAAEVGTRKVITDHSTIGLVITTDGSITEFDRSDYVEAEKRVIQELQSIGKPYLILLNSTHPETDDTRALAESLAETYGASVVPVNCKKLNEDTIAALLRDLLLEFPVTEIGVQLPEWLESLPDDHERKRALYQALLQNADAIRRLRDASDFCSALQETDPNMTPSVVAMDVSSGRVQYALQFPRGLYYEILTEASGVTLRSDRELVRYLSETKAVQEQYALVRDALQDVQETGYGVVMPTADQLRLEEPEIVRQGGKYSVRLHATAPSIHMLKANVHAEVSPEPTGEGASGEILGFLLQGFQGDVNQLWESNIFGKSLYSIAREDIEAKLQSMPEKAAGKLQETIQKIINDGGGTLFCFIL
ncbi:MAG: stage IV sporulation protein A [Oscillospiraceae bacterium]|nr:stage IV sporulation protein A [Oscillospiraceae bacterium]